MILKNKSMHTTILKKKIIDKIHICIEYFSLTYFPRMFLN